MYDLLLANNFFSEFLFGIYDPLPLPQVMLALRETWVVLREAMVV